MATNLKDLTQEESPNSLITLSYIASAEPPDNTRILWIDTAANTGGLKYYNGTEWTHVPVAYT